MKNLLGFLVLSAVVTPAAQAISCGTVAAPTTCTITVGGTTAYTFSNFQLVASSGSGGGQVFAAADIGIDLSSSGGLSVELTFSKTDATPSPVFGVNAGQVSSFSTSFDATLSAVASGSVAFASPFRVAIPIGNQFDDGVAAAQFLIPGAPTCQATADNVPVDCTVPALPLTVNSGGIVTLSGNNGNASILSYNNRFDATFTATVPPTLAKAFNPAVINAGGVSTLTITLSNLEPTVATLTSFLTDVLPAGMVIAAPPNAGTTCGGAGAVVAIAGGSAVTLPQGRTIPASGSCTLTVDVTAPPGGPYVNTLFPATLVTTNGANVASAAATLTSLATLPPTLAKAFSPAVINAGGVSTLAITLSNSAPAVATLTGPLTDTLPAGMVVAAAPNAGTTCGGAGAVAAVAGGTTVTLPAGRTIPGNGSCTLTVDVTAQPGGPYVNTLPAGALVTSNGNSAASAAATLTAAATISVPTLSEGSLALLAALLALAAFAALRRRSV